MDLKRWYQYVRTEEDGQKSYEPALCIAPKRNRGDGNKNAFVVTLGAAYKYCMDDKRSKDYTSRAVQYMWDLFDMGPVMSPKKMAEYASFIQDGLYDLIKMPPKDLSKKVRGEGEMLAEGRRRSFLITDLDWDDQEKEKTMFGYNG